MSNAETMGPGNRVVNFCRSGDKKLDPPATESSVSQTCNILTQTCAHDQTRGFQHFEHACEQFQINLKFDSSDSLPGPPFGPRYRRITTVFSPFLIDPVSIARTKSSSVSKVRALPVKPSPSFPVILAIAPPGARLPLKTLHRHKFCEGCPYKSDSPDVSRGLYGIF